MADGGQAAGGGDQPAYRLNEGELSLPAPERWTDETLTVLRLAGEGQAVASLVVTRETLPLGMTVADYIAGELARLAKTLPEFQRIGSAPVAWADAPGEAALTRWRSNDGPVDQISACRRAKGQALLLFTATHPTPMPSHAFEALLAAIASFEPRT